MRAVALAGTILMAVAVAACDTPGRVEPLPAPQTPRHPLADGIPVDRLSSSPGDRPAIIEVQPRTAGPNERISRQPTRRSRREPRALPDPPEALPPVRLIEPYRRPSQRPIGTIDPRPGTIRTFPGTIQGD